MKKLKSNEVGIYLFQIFDNINSLEPVNLSAINSDRIINRRDKVFTKVFIFHSTVYILSMCLYSRRTMSMSIIWVFSSRFIIISPNFQSFATLLLNCWLIQCRSSSNRGREWFCGLVECRYLNTCVVAKLFEHIFSLDFLTIYFHKC